MKTKEEIFGMRALVADAYKMAEIAERNFRYTLGKLVADCVGENQPMAFNDETGFPTFDFDSGEQNVAIVGVIAVKGANGQYYFDFNCDCDEDSENGLAADGWFSEFDGTYDSYNLYNAITEWIDNKYEPYKK